MAEKIYSGRVITAVASKFKVDTGKEVLSCFARKKLKLDGGDIFVGDWVKVIKDRDTFVIDNVLPRRNSLLRPYVSNIDICLIVIAPEPEPDFLLVDKVIVNCLEQDIVPILVANKTDLVSIPLEDYSEVCEVFFCSAETKEGIEVLSDRIKGKTVCFAGQSAVGKSSMINAILDSKTLAVGELARKIKRGKNTTRRTEILSLGGSTWMVDTCGFSMLEAIDLQPEDLRLYFDEMEKFRPECRFNTCTHTDEPDCAVKANIGSGVSAARYERYKTIYNELIDRRKNKYD